MGKEISFVHIVGDGIGKDFAKALNILLTAFPTLKFRVDVVENFREKMPDGSLGGLNPLVIERVKGTGLCIKGPTRTLKGTGPQSANVVLRAKLDLYNNQRPAYYMPGVVSPIKTPDLVNVTVFRENTQDVYMGVEASPGSEKSKKLIDFLRKEWGYPLEMFTEEDLVGVGIKLISKRAAQRIFEEAMKYTIATGRKKLTVVHKGNIMKYTEGAFLDWCFEYAKDNYRDQVFFPDEWDLLSEEERNKKIFVNEVIADNALAQLVAKPSQFETIVTMNLNGDYISDLTAALVGGVPVAAGANIGLDAAMFEAIGGTGDDIAGKNIANPTAFLLAFAMMLEYKECTKEANAIRESIGELYANHIGTADMKFAEKLSTTEFAERVAELVAKKLEVVVV